MDRHSLKEAITEPKVKWRMNPVLAGAGLYEADDFEATCNPYSRIETNQLGKLMTECLKDQGLAASKKGKRTLLIRHSAIGFLALLGGDYSALIKIAP